jgi:LysM repeat protein
MNGTKFAFLLLGVAILSISLISGYTYIQAAQVTKTVTVASSGNNTPQATVPSNNTPNASSTTTVASSTTTVATASTEKTTAPTSPISNPPTAQAPTKTPVPTAMPVPYYYPYFYRILGTHIVRSGETLYCIGRAYGVQPKAIAEINGLPLDATLSIGQALKIPNTPWERIPKGKICKEQFDSPYSQIPASMDGLIFISYHEPAFNQAGKADNEPIGENRIIRVVAPDHMKFGVSGIVRLTFSPGGMTPESPAPTSEQPVSTQESAPIPINGDLFDKYLIYAIARIDSAGFNIAPSSDMKQLVRKGKENTWVWSISPLEGERQNLIISLWLSYDPINPQETAPRPEDSLWTSSFDMNVTDTLGLNAGELKSISILTGIIGVIPILFSLWEKIEDIFKKKGSKTNEEPAS